MEVVLSHLSNSAPKFYAIIFEFVYVKGASIRPKPSNYLQGSFVGVATIGRELLVNDALKHSYKPRPAAAALPWLAARALRRSAAYASHLLSPC